jgi:hypothetical protein
MKKLILTLALVGVSAVAFGQGQVQMENDLHTVQLTTDTSKLLAADVGSAGVDVPVGGTLLPSGKNIVVGLYAGNVSSSLSLITTLPLSQDPNSIQDGAMSPAAVTLPTGFPGGVATFFSFAAWDGAFATPTLALANGSYGGSSMVFTVTPSGGTGLPPSIQNASWTEGSVIIGLAAVPEPSTFALAGLGAAALLIFRRRK